MTAPTRIAIKIERPPLFDEIDRVFSVRGKPILFAWGDVVYNPEGMLIPPELQVHERVHCLRQCEHEGGIEGWWKEYLTLPKFRLHEELLAHQAEYQWLRKHLKRRNERRIALMAISKRLASPLYGNLIGLTRARELVRGNVEL